MKKKIKETIEIEKYTYFHFAYMDNAINLSMALAQAGYFINICSDGTGYRVDIYKRSLKD